MFCYMYVAGTVKDTVLAPKQIRIQQLHAWVVANFRYKNTKSFHPLLINQKIIMIMLLMMMIGLVDSLPKQSVDLEHV